jgi:hypothetical protein
MSDSTNHGNSKENKTIISFKNSFWLVIIVVGLFVAALNFIQAESGGEAKGEAKENKEMKATSENKAEQTEKKAEDTTPKAETPAVDSAAKAK